MDALIYLVHRVLIDVSQSDFSRGLCTLNVKRELIHGQVMVRITIHGLKKLFKVDSGQTNDVVVHHSLNKLLFVDSPIAVFMKLVVQLLAGDAVFLHMLADLLEV